MKTGSREVAFDIAKFIAMYMVVYSHVMSYRSGFDFKTMPSYAMNFIMAINMPVFFMISGYFSRRLHLSHEWHRLANRILKYFWPLALFGVLFAILEALIFHKYLVNAIPLWALKKFLFNGWFFYALAGCDMLTFLAHKYGKSSYGLLLICGMGFLLCSLGSGRVWHAANIVAMIPFYWFGLWCLPFIKDNCKHRVAMLLIAGGVMIIVTFFCGNIATNGLAFYWSRFDIINPTVHDFLMMIARYGVGILGSIFLLEIVALLTKKTSFLCRVARYGTETLGIYILQGFLITELVTRVIGLNASCLLMLFIALLVYIASYLIVKTTKVNDRIALIFWGCHSFNSK